MMCADTIGHPAELNGYHFRSLHRVDRLKSTFHIHHLRPKSRGEEPSIRFLSSSGAFQLRINSGTRSMIGFREAVLSPDPEGAKASGEASTFGASPNGVRFKAAGSTRHPPCSGRNQP